ncbi:MAG TPA: rhodanese-like domain-containing protein [Gaiellaceae bacterium]|nr:rhodanese-like domain-containing protein [Gaiellaceae bacterium]
MTPQETRDALAAGAVVLDLRPPRPFAAGHLPGALTMQFNRADLADRAELMLPQGLRYVVHAEPEPIAKVAVELLRGAGFDVLGHLEGGLNAWTGSGGGVEELPILDVDELRDALGDVVVVDAREPFEHRHAHVPGALLFPPGEAWKLAGELPAGERLAVVCGDQTRSVFVASILRRHGLDAELVMGGMVDWLERGYPTEKHAPASA